MDLMVSDVAEKIDIQVEAKIIDALEQLGLDFEIIKYCGYDRVCIDLGHDKNTCKRYCCNSGIIVQTSSKDVCRIYSHEILYIAIEDRKSVLYMIDRKVETNYRLDHWKELLDLETFAQPHHSFIVNLNYVDEVTKEWVKVKYRDKEYQVYTSSRKIGAFKKAFLKFGER